jgi:prolyl-tRNA synthetase
MAGSYTFLPLGWRVEQKVERIIREEMNRTGAQEMRMPLLHPREIWDETGRWDSAKEVMYQLKMGDRELALSFTHEEILLDVVRKKISSYRDLPLKLYHFSTKFRQELRPRSGLLRGREFIMKDLYSVHANQEDLDTYYEQVIEAYLKAFDRMGLETHVVEAGGGVFTDQVTHELQAYTESGEDTIFYCPGCAYAQNKEIFLGKEGDPCPKCAGTIKQTRGIELGNVFRFGTDYSKKMKVTFTNFEGKEEHPWFGSYGIGTSRVVGAIAEIFHDKNGLIWPMPVAPYHVALVGLFGGKEEVKEQADRLYEDLGIAGVEVLYDDRDESAGKKFSDADLIGLPIRVTISLKSLEKQSVELKYRDSEKSELIPLVEAVDTIQKYVSARL